MEDALPQLWVDAADSFRADEIIKLSMQPHVSVADWQCPDCKENIEGVFGQCWHCGFIR